MRRISFVSHMNVLTVRSGFGLIDRLDEVPSVISLHIASLRAHTRTETREVCHVADNNSDREYKVSTPFAVRHISRPIKS